MIPDRFHFLEAQAASSGLLRSLIEDGFAIVRGAASPDFVARFGAGLDQRFEHTPYCVGPFHGPRTKRFHRLLARAPEAEALVLQAPIFEAVQAILGGWCDFPELNLAQGVEIHPGAPEQIPHCDQAMWPAPKGAIEYCVNVFWPVTRFTPENGATRIWPRTHFRPRQPGEPLASPFICELEPGDAMVILGSTMHAAGANMSAVPRRAAIFSYCLGWLKAYENQSLAYSIDEVRAMDPAIAPLLGYRWHRPNLGTFDGQCPSILLENEHEDHLATVDALSPEHVEMVESFALAAARGSGGAALAAGRTQ